jgi:hypothetical protein
MAASTRARVSGRTGALSLSTRETVGFVTPARLATSLMVAMGWPARLAWEPVPETGFAVPYRDADADVKGCPDL